MIHHRFSKPPPALGEYVLGHLFQPLPSLKLTAHENPIFPCKYHQNGGFSMAIC